MSKQSQSIVKKFELAFINHTKGNFKMALPALTKLIPALTKIIGM